MAGQHEMDTLSLTRLPVMWTLQRTNLLLQTVPEPISVSDTVDYWALRTCLSAPLPEHAEAARLLSEAANAVLSSDLEVARDLVRKADIPLLFDRTNLVMNGGDPSIQRRRPVAMPPGPVIKVSSRMPSSVETAALFARDGWHCRFCDCRIVPPKVRRAMQIALPGAIPWCETEGYHGGFYAMSASVDHVVPHSAGGGNDQENLVTACWSCQFGRGAWSLEEVGLSDPRARPPIKNEWDGLTGLLGNAALARVAQTSTPQTVETRDGPPPAPSRMTNTEWFASLDAIQPKPSTRLTSFVGGCADLGVTWRLNKVLLVRMVVGGKMLDVVGVLPNGLCEIPWSIGDTKDAFKDFAEVVAASIPGSIFYETPKTWTVSKASKRRINILELLDAAPGLRQALEALHSNLTVA
jgi:hypothetical protein